LFKIHVEKTGTILKNKKNKHVNSTVNIK